ncbi:hypothetical protein EON64_04145 [archaeon]|nr:MAG: hypothetical protein EON64_04145 [archaeon]
MQQSDNFNSVLLDGKGWILVPGATKTALYGSLIGLRDITVAKYSSLTGSMIWRRQFGQTEKLFGLT